MSTLAELAMDYGFQPFELAVFLRLDDDVSLDTKFSPEEEADYREVIENTEENGMYWPQEIGD
jgi:hypothetical protein